MESPSVAILNPRSSILSSKQAFTLTELLIVIALIVLLLAMAVPAFNFISGGRSIDAAQNVVSAMLGRARARAIETERYAGVAFYLDPVTGKSTMTIVVQRDGDATVGGEDPYLNYKGWKESTSQATVQYKKGQEVIAIVADGDPNSPSAVPNGSTIPPDENRMITKKFVCLQDHDAVASTRPPNATYWGTAQQKFLDFDIDAESETIPVGVGVQLVNDTKGVAGADRYVRTGVVLFDGRGRFDSIPYAIRANGAWGKRLFPSGGGVDIGDPTPTLYSQLGIALYDLSAFKDAGWTENDTALTNGTIPAYGNAATATETAVGGEEEWLDKNGLLLSINRYNGTLVRGE
jgi:prepilin-type N-terminal cleavage/methylation domain-containing protein